MKEINQHVGRRIRMYRKSRRLTLQQLADRIHKSKSSVSKYETGEITLDIETLAEISEVLQVSIHQLTDYQPLSDTSAIHPASCRGISPFFRARRMYFYFYDGKSECLKDGIIDIRESETEPGNYTADLSISVVMPSGRNRGLFYSGKVVYSDMLIRFSFVNQYNPLEEDLLYIFNPLEFRDYTDGLLCGISSADLMPCAFKCLVTITPQEHTEELKKTASIQQRGITALAEIQYASRRQSWCLTKSL